MGRFRKAFKKTVSHHGRPLSAGYQPVVNWLPDKVTGRLKIRYRKG